MDYGNIAANGWEETNSLLGGESTIQESTESVNDLRKAMTVGAIQPAGEDLAPGVEGTLPSLSTAKKPYTLNRKPDSVPTHAAHMSQPTSQKDRGIEGQCTRSCLFFKSMALGTAILGFLETTTLCVKYSRKFHQD